MSRVRGSCRTHRSHPRHLTNGRHTRIVTPEMAHYRPDAQGGDKRGAKASARPYAASDPAGERKPPDPAIRCPGCRGAASPSGGRGSATGIPSPGRSTAPTISFTEVSIPRWISSAADGTLDMTVGSLLPVAPPNHLAAVHVTSVGRSTTQAKWLPTAATGAGRFMLTYSRWSQLIP